MKMNKFIKAELNELEKGVKDFATPTKEEFEEENDICARFIEVAGDPTCRIASGACAQFIAIQVSSLVENYHISPHQLEILIYSLHAQLEMRIRMIMDAMKDTKEMKVVEPNKNDEEDEED